MKTLLVKLAHWIFRRYSVQLMAIPPDVQDMLPEARRLCSVIDEKPQAGEWKRHQVYARMIKLFPQYSNRDASLAIEIAVRELPQ